MVFRPFVVIAGVCALLIVGCVSGPGFSGDHINKRLDPADVLADVDGAMDETVVWGGRIIQAEPKADSTTLEILAFPLYRSQQPDAGKDSLGRFLVIYPGYLEPQDYSTGRMVTAVGRLEEIRLGQVGKADYRYPVLRGDDLYLWPPADEAREPRVHFGVGVGIFR